MHELAKRDSIVTEDVDCNDCAVAVASAADAYDPIRLVPLVYTL